MISAIGKVVSTRKIPTDDAWDTEEAFVELDAHFGADALTGLGDFSHAEIIFYMNQVNKVESGARHPRGRTDWPLVGIFAQRGKNRPNQIGATICRILKVDGRRVYLQGLDAIDGTPVLDIKPWVKEFGPRGEVKQPNWMSELMREYW